jgi:hypothetical protein
VDERGLLAHVVSKFAPSQWENVASEALLYVLDDLGADALQSLVSAAGIGLSGCRWTSQLSDSDGLGRPDLVALDASDRPLLVMEAKFWAGLTANQPVGYLARQRAAFAGSTGSPLLLFVAPGARRESLVTHLAARLTGASRTSEGPLIVLDAVEGRVAVASWTAVLETLEAVAQTRGSAESQDALMQIRGLCATSDRQPWLPLGISDVDMSVGQLYFRLAETVHAVVDRLRHDKVIDEQRSEYNTRNSTGRQVRSALTGDWFYVLFSQFRWAQDYPTPFWLSFENPRAEVRTALTSLDSSASPRVLALKDRVVLALHPPIGADSVETVELLASSVAKVLEALPKNDG